MLEHVGLLEQTILAGLARGRIDTDALAALLQDFHRPREPLLPAPLQLRALVWALELLPRELSAQDTLWVSGEQLLGTPRGELSRIGPAEWAASGTFAELRRLALACAVLMASSRALRERLVGEDVDLHELAHDRAALTRLAFGLGVDANELLLASERVPDFVERLLKLSVQPWALAVRTRGISRGDVTARAQALWRDLLQALAALNPDGRKVAVWLAPAWVSDVVSPYVRDVLPLLQRWVSAQPGLKSFARLIASGDEDAMYLCANLLFASDAEIDAERDDNEAAVGILSLRDARGVRLGRVVDTARLDPAAVDPRLGEIAQSDAPLVIVLEESEADTAYALRRLLCDVRADFIDVRINISGLAAPGHAHFVARARVAEAPFEPMVFVSSPRESGPTLHALALPDFAYLECFDPWSAGARELVFEAERAQQGALVAALLRGDFDPARIVQSFWLEASDDSAYLASKRAHIADAIAQWRALLSPPPAAPQPPKAATKRDLPTTFRFRV